MNKVFGILPRIFSPIIFTKRKRKKKKYLM